MVNWRDPEVEDFCQHISYYIALVAAGYYTCDFFATIGFDWEYIKGRRPWRWVLVPFFVGRYAGALALVLGVRVTLVFGSMDNCTTWWRAIYGISCFASTSASLLFMLRVFALWGRSLWIGALCVVFWVGMVATTIHDTISVKAEFLPRLFLCGLKTTGIGRSRYIVYVAADFMCLLLGMVVLYQHRGVGFWKLLVSQGTIYFVVITVAYVPELILVWLNLNDGMNEALQPVTMVSLVICATRMYRALVEYHAGDASDTFTMSTRIFATARRTTARHEHTVVIPPDVEAALPDGTGLGRTPGSTATVDAHDSKHLPLYHVA